MRYSGGTGPEVHEEDQVEVSPSGDTRYPKWTTGARGQVLALARMRVRVRVTDSGDHILGGPVVMSFRPEDLTLIHSYAEEDLRHD